MRTEVEQHVGDVLQRIRAHPFILDAHAGRLTQDQATRWIYCAGRESRTFPEILRHLLSWSRNDVVHAVLQENLDDELGNGDPNDAHFMHYLQLLDDLGLSRDWFDSYHERAGITLALSLAYNVATSGVEEAALGYMLVNEAMTPVTYLAARDALLPYFPHMATGFFDLHIAVDELHVRALYEAVHACQDRNLADLHFGINLGERGMAVLLDEAYGVFDKYEGVSVGTAVGSY